MSVISISNPHGALEAIRRRPGEVKELVEGGPSAGNAWAEVREACGRAGIQVRRSRPGSEGGRGSGWSISVTPRAPVPLEGLFADSSAGGFWLALDCIQDPQNLGAIFRSAAFFGARGVVLTEERSAPLSSVVYDVASGGIECVPFCREINLRRALEAAKAAGIWVMGASEHAKERLESYSADRPWLIVLGNEERGMRRLTVETCDVVVAIKGNGKGVGSLNVGAAAAVLMSRLA